MTEPAEGRPAAADVRAVLAEHGYPVAERGRLGKEDYELYEAIRSGELTAPADLPPDGGAEGDAAERPPRRVRTARPGLRDRLSKAQGRARGKSKAKRPKHPRVPVDRLCGMAWEGLARILTPVSPATGRCLQLEAPVAGLIIEDVVKGTFADRALQPIARAEEKGKKVFALAAPPMIVLALEQAQSLPDPQRIAREAFLVPMLREALATWDEVAADKLEEQMARAESRGPAYERADRLMAMIFAPPTPPPAGAGTSPEDEAAARAQQMAGAAA